MNAQPGITVSDLRAELGIGWGTFYHHLQRLVAAREVEMLSHGRRCLLYPLGHPSLRHAAARSLLGGPTTRAIALNILRHPRASIPELRAAHRLSSRAVYYHVRRLVDAGLVTSSGDARLRDLVATPQLEALLAEAEGARPRKPKAAPADKN